MSGGVFTAVIVGTQIAGSLLAAFVAGWFAARRNDRLRNEGLGSVVAPPMQFAVGIFTFCLFGSFAATSNPWVVASTGQASETSWWATAVLVGFAAVGGFLAYFWSLYTVRMDEKGISARTLVGRWRHVSWDDIVSVECSPHTEAFVIKGSLGTVVKVAQGMEGLSRFAAVVLDKVPEGQIESETRAPLESNARLERLEQHKNEYRGTG